MTLLDHPILKYVVAYAHVAAESGRDNVDFLQLPDQLRELALAVQVNCVSCGRIVNCLRARAQSERSRIAGTPVERRLFYAATCPSEVDAGCSRTKAAQQHKRAFVIALGGGAAKEIVETVDALCLKEPWLELILLGIKTLETRTKCLRKGSGEVVFTSSQTRDEAAWVDPNVGGRLDEAAQVRALGGLGKLRGVVSMGGFRLGVPGQDDAAACIGILLPTGDARFVASVGNPRRIAEVSTVRVQERSGKVILVSGSSQGFFRVPRSIVTVLA